MKAIIIYSKGAESPTGYLYCPRCGNHTEHDGFREAHPDGSEVDYDETWDDVHYICGSCGILLEILYVSSGE